MSDEYEDYQERFQFRMTSSEPDSRNISFDFTVPTITEVLEHMKSFLNACGYTYVASLSASTNNGTSWVVTHDGTYEFEEDEVEDVEEKKD